MEHFIPGERVVAIDFDGGSGRYLKRDFVYTILANTGDMVCLKEIPGRKFYTRRFRPTGDTIGPNE